MGGREGGRERNRKREWEVDERRGKGMKFSCSG